VQLGETGNVRDPWQQWRPERLSDVQIEAAVAAAHHLLSQDLPPMFDVDTLRAMWRAGRRELAEAVHRTSAGAA
jgi:hypothetical protein